MIERPRISEERPKNRLFSTPNAVKPILDFLEATEIGRRPKETEEENTANRRLDEQDLDRLEREEAEKEEGEEEREEAVHTEEQQISTKISTIRRDLRIIRTTTTAVLQT